LHGQQSGLAHKVLRTSAPAETATDAHLVQGQMINLKDAGKEPVDPLSDDPTDPTETTMNGMRNGFGLPH
jgi:hypothetical protein